MNAERHLGTSDVYPWIRFWARSFDGLLVASMRVTNPDGSLLSFEQALRRSDMVWAKGLGAGTPLVGQFLMAAQHYELSANA